MSVEVSSVRFEIDLTERAIKQLLCRLEEKIQRHVSSVRLDEAEVHQIGDAAPTVLRSVRIELEPPPKRLAWKSEYVRHEDA